MLSNPGNTDPKTRLLDCFKHCAQVEWDGGEWAQGVRAHARTRTVPTPTRHYSRSKGGVFLYGSTSFCVCTRMRWIGRCSSHYGGSVEDNMTVCPASESGRSCKAVERLLFPSLSSLRPFFGGWLFFIHVHALLPKLWEHTVWACSKRVRVISPVERKTIDISRNDDGQTRVPRDNP